MLATASPNGGCKTDFLCTLQEFKNSVQLPKFFQDFFLITTAKVVVITVMIFFTFNYGNSPYSTLEPNSKPKKIKVIIFNLTFNFSAYLYFFQKVIEEIVIPKRCNFLLKKGA